MSSALELQTPNDARIITRSISRCFIVLANLLLELYSCTSITITRMVLACVTYYEVLWTGNRTHDRLFCALVSIYYPAPALPMSLYFASSYAHAAHLCANYCNLSCKRDIARTRKNDARTSGFFETGRARTEVSVVSIRLSLVRTRYSSVISCAWSWMLIL